MQEYYCFWSSALWICFALGDSQVNCLSDLVLKQYKKPKRTKIIYDFRSRSSRNPLIGKMQNSYLFSLLLYIWPQPVQLFVRGEKLENGVVLFIDNNCLKFSKIIASNFRIVCTTQNTFFNVLLKRPFVELSNKFTLIVGGLLLAGQSSNSLRISMRWSRQKWPWLTGLKIRFTVQTCVWSLVTWFTKLIHNKLA